MTMFAGGRALILALLCVYVSFNVASANLDLNLFSNSLGDLDATLSKLQSLETSSAVSFESASLSQLCSAAEQQKPANWNNIESVNQKLRELSEEIFRADLDDLTFLPKMPSHDLPNPRIQRQQHPRPGPKPHPRPDFGLEPVCRKHGGDLCLAELMILINVSSHLLPVHMGVPHCVPHNVSAACIDEPTRDSIQGEWEALCQKLSHDGVQVVVCEAHFECGPPRRPGLPEHLGNERDSRFEGDFANDDDDHSPRRGGHRMGTRPNHRGPEIDGEDENKDGEGFPHRQDHRHGRPRRGDDKESDCGCGKTSNRDGNFPRRGRHDKGGNDPRRPERETKSQGAESHDLDDMEEDPELSKSEMSHGGRSFGSSILNPAVFAIAGAVCGVGLVVGLISFGVYTLVRRRRAAAAAAAQQSYSAVPVEDACSVAMASITPKHVA